MDGYLVTKLLNIKNMWAARDKNGDLRLHKVLPIRVDNLGRSILHNVARPINMCVRWDSGHTSIYINDSDIVFDIKWSDEPKEVKIIDV